MAIPISKFLLDTYNLNISDVNNEYADNEWVKDPAGDDECIEDTYDKSFRDVKKRVQDKYENTDFYKKFMNLSYEDSLKNVEPYMDNNSTKRIPVLGVTEHLGPFVSNSISHSNKSNKKSNKPTPFIVYAPLIWSDDDNIHVVRCFATGLKTKIYDKIIILLPLIRDQMFNKEKPRITIFEIYQMYKILGDFLVEVDEDHEKYTLTVLASQFNGGKKIFRRGNSRKNKNIKKRKAGKTRKQPHRRG
jgi:hypothetical protein